jgi:hypothetical protein
MLANAQRWRKQESAFPAVQRHRIRALPRSKAVLADQLSMEKPFPVQIRWSLTRRTSGLRDCRAGWSAEQHVRRERVVAAGLRSTRVIGAVLRHLVDHRVEQATKLSKPEPTRHAFQITRRLWRPAARERV